MCSAAWTSVPITVDGSPLPPDRPCLGERLRVGGAELAEGRIDPSAEHVGQRSGGEGRVGDAFRVECRELSLGKRFAPGVGQHPV